MGDVARGVTMRSGAVEAVIARIVAAAVVVVVLMKAGVSLWVERPAQEQGLFGMCRWSIV